MVELIKEFFKQEPRCEINPDEAVALGAAVQAGLKSGSLTDSGLIVTDVAPYSMGIEVLKGWQGLAYRPGAVFNQLLSAIQQYLLPKPKYLAPHMMIKKQLQLKYSREKKNG